MKNLKNLKALIRKLNAPIIYEGETFESKFDFRLEKRIYEGKTFVCLFDANENYGLHYEEDINALNHDCAEEFGFKFTYQSDDIMPQLEKALKKDLGEDAYLEYENSVVMIICK